MELTRALEKGFYTVGNNSFLLKQDALIEASKTGKPISWIFNNAIFEKASKAPRSSVNILDLYKNRAQQLRDSYDYIILAYSGGSDSHTVLESFINNNIKLDEVWCDQQFKMLDSIDFIPSLDTSTTNLPSEWHFVIKPKLEILQNTHSNIKIHISDACYSLKDELVSDKIYARGLSLGYIGSYHQIKRWGYISDYAQHMRDTTNKRVCVIMGIEKCIPYIHGNMVGFSLIDGPTFFKSDVVEYFFWTPNMPEIVVEQAHLVWDYIRTHIEALEVLNQNKANNPTSWFLDRSANFDNVVKRVCYPGWDLSTFQVNKQTVMNGEGWGYYTHLFKNEQFFKTWFSDRLNMLKATNVGQHFHRVKELYEPNKYILNFIIGTLK